MPSISESWKNYPYDDPERHSISALVSHNRKLDIASLARLWLQELANVGLQEINRSSGGPPKEPASYYPRSEPLHSDVVPIKLEESREVLWLKLNGRRSERGYKRAEVLDTFMSTDRAILAALTALEAKEIRTKELDESLSKCGSRYDQFSTNCRSADFTRQRSLVRSQHRPLRKNSVLGTLPRSLRCIFRIQGQSQLELLGVVAVVVAPTAPLPSNTYLSPPP